PVGSALALVPILLASIGCRPSPPRSIPHPAPADTLVDGSLHAPVRIVTDPWGIPHIRAERLDDLYFAWGYVTARDRLWQIEHDRRSGHGTLSEWVGNRALRGDGGAQLLELASLAHRFWERDSVLPEVAMPLERYAAGINAFV